MGYHDITRGGPHVKPPKFKAAPRAKLHPLTDEQLECQVLQHAAAVHCVQQYIYSCEVKGDMQLQTMADRLAVPLSSLPRRSLIDLPDAGAAPPDRYG